MLALINSSALSGLSSGGGGCLPCAGGSGDTSNFLWGASRGRNAFQKGQKSENLPKMTDFCHSFLVTEGEVRPEPLTGGGGKCPPCMHSMMPPLA